MVQHAASSGSTDSNNRRVTCLALHREGVKARASRYREALEVEAKTEERGNAGERFPDLCYLESDSVFS